jgi:hypothetical protein
MRRPATFCSVRKSSNAFSLSPPALNAAMGCPCGSSCTLLPFGTSCSFWFDWDLFFENESGSEVRWASEEELKVSVIASPTTNMICVLSNFFMITFCFLLIRAFIN